MRTFVLDTSVAVAWYLPEVFSEPARAWQSRLLDGEIRLVAPSLHYWEVANVLRTNVRKGDVEEDLAVEIFSTHLQAPLEILEPDPSLVLSVALEYQSSAYDAVYIALARFFDVPLVTAERATTPWVDKLGEQAEIVGPLGAP